MPNPENISKYKYKKGQSGNPNGRPSVLPELKEAIAKALEKKTGGISELDRIIEALVKKAKKGDVRAAQELFDRGYGKVKQTMETSFKEQPLFAPIDLDVPEE